MTADYIAFHAAERPDAVAFVNRGRSITYADFSLAIRKFTRAVGALGLQCGSHVAVGCNDAFLHWLLLLACEQLGIAAASFRSDEGRECAPLLTSVDLVLAEPHYPNDGARRHHAVTPSWIQDVLALPNEDVERLLAKAPDAPLRIIRTSGTTGASKRFLVTRKMHDAVIAQWNWVTGLTRHSRFLLTLPFTVRAIYDVGTACLRMGGTVVCDNRPSVPDALTANGVTHAIFLPVNLKTLLDQLPPGFMKPRELTILSFGAAVSRALRERAIARLATALCELYGAVETAAIFATWRHDADGFGTLLPNVRIDVVDEHADPLPLGTIGRIRAKTEMMAERYLDDPETTQRMFRDGWFYSGDVGILQPGGRLKILGRADDLLNIGGNKFAPPALEELILNQDLAADVGICSMLNADGIEELYVVVSEPKHDVKTLQVRVTAAFAHIQTERIHIMSLARIPRNANGKIERKLLKEMVTRVLRAK
jgi:acyl-coenzyme A synthetase/AMP-(fatty) acid ligase